MMVTSLTRVRLFGLIYADFLAKRTPNHGAFNYELPFYTLITNITNDWLIINKIFSLLTANRFR